MRTHTPALATFALFCLMLTPEVWGAWVERAESLKGFIAFGVLVKCVQAAFALIAVGIWVWQ
ncbi:hypothetical protein D8I24_6544 [Cupriavidus necator H850]|uniref:hypothetical protein n=1 Tax=Cupriavidus necator TaxID=106590 RepID=UPI00129DF52F|nr:hypothetical protein [Cupriavidus necator]KAI3597728.1 hypothetical protein D8I24_6544 [Cupriavidus necator H850]